MWRAGSEADGQPVSTFGSPQLPLPSGDRAGVRGLGGQEYPRAPDTLTLPVRLPVRPPDEPGSSRTPSRERESYERPYWLSQTLGDLFVNVLGELLRSCDALQLLLHQIGAGGIEAPPAAQ